MLLRNESRVKHSIDIKLVFDDNTIKELEIHESDCVHVSYRRNGCLKCGVGVIREIKPYIRKFCCEIIESATIILDMSEENNAHIEKIDLDDIVDIDIVYPCCCQIPDINNPQKPQCNCGSNECKCNKESEPPKNQCNCNNICKPPIHYSCLVGTAITDRGVIAHG